MKRILAQLTTDTLSGEFAYEIYGKDIPENDVVKDAWKTHTKYLGVADGVLTCFLTYQEGHKIIEMVAWSPEDDKEVLASLNQRLADSVTTTFMGWFLHNKFTKALWGG